MEKTFIVHGKGLEEALDKAAIILHCPKERVAYEILQEPKPGRYGQAGVACKLRVTPISPNADELGSPDQPDPLWDVPMPLSPEELATLAPGFFLKDLGEAVAQDLARSAAPAFSPSRPPAARRVVSGSLSPFDDPISHVGDLHIQGSVRKGTRVTTTGSLTVDGSVETAFLDAGDDVMIAGGLLGTARSAGGSVRCQFAQGAHIEAPHGEIIVVESAMHCQIHSGCGVSIGDMLLGGSCYGEDLVEIRVAGSESGVPTLLISGRNRRLQDQIERIRERAQTLTERSAEIDAVRHEFLPLEEAGTRVAPDERARLWRAVLRKARLNTELRRLSRQKSTLLGMINVERGSRICITDRIYPGVKISIDDAGLEVHKLTQYATFSKDYETGQLRTTPYH